MLRIRQRMEPWSTATHSYLSASVRVWTVCGGFGRRETRPCSISHRCSIGFKSGIELGTPLHWSLSDPGTPWLLWRCVVGHYPASVWNRAPQHRRKVSQLDATQLGPQTVQTLTEALREEWAVIDEGFIHRLIRSMPRRCRQCVQSRGEHTSYSVVFGLSSRIFKAFLTIWTVLSGC